MPSHRKAKRSKDTGCHFESKKEVVRAHHRNQKKEKSQVRKAVDETKREREDYHSLERDLSCRTHEGGSKSRATRLSLHVKQPGK